MKKITVYDCGTCIGHYSLNTLSAIELIEKLLSGTNYDIIVTHTEDK